MAARGRQPPPGRAGRAGAPGRRARRRRPDPGARILAALPAIAFAVFIVAEGGLIFALGVLALGTMALHELFRLWEAARPVKLAGFLALAALIFAARYGTQFQVVLMEVLAVPVLFALALAQPRREGLTVSLALTLLAVWWVGLALAHVVLLRGLRHGDGIVIDVLVGTFLGDTGAYFGGRAFGRRPLAPRLSPNKTVEGLLIGMLTAIVAVWFAGLYQDWLKGWQALVLGLGVALAAPVGDLFESLIKREVRAKDTGRLFGPHGGALDRLDAALFTVVAGYYIWVAMV
jgi:phosphatidate cytidylyltransferase